MVPLVTRRGTRVWQKMMMGVVRPTTRSGPITDHRGSTLAGLLIGPRFFFGPAPVSVELAEHIRGLAHRVRGLLPLARDPEAFHVEKDAIVHELLRLAGRYAPPRSRETMERQKRPTPVRTITVNGRLVTVQHKRANFSI